MKQPTVLRDQIGCAGNITAVDRRVDFGVNRRFGFGVDLVAKRSKREDAEQSERKKGVASLNQILKY